MAIKNDVKTNAEQIGSSFFADMIASQPPQNSYTEDRLLRESINQMRFAAAESQLLPLMIDFTSSI